MENGPIAQFWLERSPDKREVGGSSPPRPTIAPCPFGGLQGFGDIAQLGERRLCKPEAAGSIPAISTLRGLADPFFDNRI